MSCLTRSAGNGRSAIPQPGEIIDFEVRPGEEDVLKYLLEQATAVGEKALVLAQVDGTTVVSWRRPR